MIAAWLPYFHFLRFARQQPFGVADAGDDGPSASGNGAQPGEEPPPSDPEATEPRGDNSKEEPQATANEVQGEANGHARKHPEGHEEDSGLGREAPSGDAPAPAAEARPTMDEEAFKEELTEHLDSMYRLALSLSKNPRDAEDLTQEATLKALNHWRQYKPGTNMRAWLLAIVRNAFINRYRRQRNRPGSVEFDDVEPFLSDPTANNGEGRHLSVRDIDELGRLGELLDDEVKKALDELSDDFRETFLLAVVEELSYKDIAQILGVPVGTVMSRLFRARKQMQAKLSAYAHDAGWLQPDTQGQAQQSQGEEGNAAEEAPSEAEESGVIES